MRVYVCSPAISETTKVDEAGEMYAEVIKGLSEYIDVFAIENERKIQQAIYEMDSDDMLIVFNADEKERSAHSQKFCQLVQSAVEQKLKIYSVAMDKNSRIPEKIIEKYQSFDVSSRLENRMLEGNYFRTAAQMLVREIVAEMFPTFYTKQKTIFVSHKRLDGEEYTAKLCDKLMLLERRQETFRDVVEVRVGEMAQDVIDTALAQSDILIFLHTPEAVKSDWINKELRYALLKGIPILWIRINDADIKNLEVQPGEKPHLNYDGEQFLNERMLEAMADEISDKVFQMIMESSQNTYEEMNEFKTWCLENDLNLKVIEQKNMFYKLSYKRKREKLYPIRDCIQYIQFFGRAVQKADQEAFIQKMRKYVYENGDCQYDTAVMISDRAEGVILGNNIFVNNFEQHLNMWKHDVGVITPKRKQKIVISGSFPEEMPLLCDQAMMQAVKTFAHEILKSGYSLIFGGHPSLQKLIFAVAEETCEKPRESLILYVSKFFQEDYNRDKLEKYAVLYEIEKESDRSNSLRKMREAMLGEKDVCAMICIGGKIGTNGELPGIDEEIAIAKKSKVPVFLVGTVGGRSSQKAQRLNERGNWKEINDADEKLNKMLLYDMDYKKVARELLRRLPD